MRVRLIYDSKLPRMISWIVPNVTAITIYPFIFIGSRDPFKSTIKHEMIHVAQIRDAFLHLPGFMIRYSFEYLIGLIRYWDVMKAYRSISYERKAYAYQYDSLTDDEKDELGF